MQNTMASNVRLDREVQPLLPDVISVDDTRVPLDTNDVLSGNSHYT